MCYVAEGAALWDSSGREAEAGRERRAKVINADGALQAAAKRRGRRGADALSPWLVQLRYWRTMREIASERNTTWFMSVPMNRLKPILNATATNRAS